MATFRLSKLVRDNIPKLMIEDHQHIETHKLHKRELQKALLEKLKEEADEALSAIDTDKDFVSELVDVKEVFDSIVHERGIEKSTLIEAQAAKRNARGGFGEGHFVDTVATESDKWTAYYRERPLQYSEVHAIDDDPAQQFATPRLEAGLYRHYKGSYYEVIHVGCHTETHEYFVAYRALYEKPMNPKVWIRPYAMFIETIEIDGSVIPRFERVQND